MKALSKKLEIMRESPLTSFDAKVKKMRSEGSDIIALNVGQPSFDVSKSMRLAVDAVSKMTGTNFYTPVQGFFEMRLALAKYHNKMFGSGYEPVDFVFTNGAKEAVALSVAAILGPQDEAILIAPYWSTYVELIAFAGGNVVVADSKEDGHINFENLLKAISSKTKLVIINSPNNPTGAVYSEDELKRFFDIVIDNDLYVISDEIYNAIIFNGAHISCSFIKEAEQRVVIINGFSKSASVTGYRLGYAISKNKNIIKGIAEIKSNFSGNVNSFFQNVITDVVMNRLEEFKAEVQKMRNELEERKNFISENLRKLRFEHSAVEGSFYLWCKIPESFKMKSEEFSKFMLSKGVAVAPGIYFGNSYDEYVRISFAASMESLKEAIKRMEKAGKPKEI